MGLDEDHIIKFAFDSSVDLNMIGENIVTLEKIVKSIPISLLRTFKTG